MSDALRGNLIEIFENKRKSESDRRRYNVFIDASLQPSFANAASWEERSSRRRSFSYSGEPDFFSDTEYPLQGEGLEIRKTSGEDESPPTYRVDVHPKLQEAFTQKENSKWERVAAEPDHEHPSESRVVRNLEPEEWVIGYYVSEDSFDVVLGDHRCKPNT